MKRSSISTRAALTVALLWSLGSAASIAAAPVGAKPAPRAESTLDPQAEELYRRGVAQYRAEQYSDAVVSFEAAYRISQAPRLLYNLATTHRKLGHLQDAIDFFDEYLKREPAIEPGRRSAVEGYLSELREQLQAQTAAPRVTASPQPLPPPPPSEPLYRKWWFWTAVGGAAVLTGVGIGLAVGLQPRQTVLDHYYDPTF